ncbi:ArsA family ATPase [Rhodococcus sp. AD45-ID]|nr:MULTISPECIES: ArsA-related P-loop ATPase [unclassified Rhodococcus (in: high G+C Gram-positive bacteria)]NMD58923.1 ArsA family ATPase [Nocardia globerula]PSR43581.1 ArsA family ATPase [Rhodococcus sp. AD45-ID]PVX65013.1 arsenite efflux ATP-binding protein ArsA [Rhodococcus globerulus]
MNAARARLQLFIGSGGSGTTTLASAAALSAATAGSKVLLMSIDRLHSLADVLAIPVPRVVTPLFDRMDVWQVDTLTLVEDKFRGVSALLDAAGSHEHGSSLQTLEPEELTGSLGIADILALAEVVGMASSGEYDVVIVDCPPSPEALRILGAPAMVSEYLERLWPRHRRLAAVAATDVRLMLLVSIIERIVSSVDEIAACIADTSHTEIHLVTSAQGSAALATRRTLSGLALSVLPVARIIVNSVVPQPVSQSYADEDMCWLSNVRAAQMSVLAGVREAADGIAVTVVEHVGTEPVGLAALGDIAVALGEGAAAQPHRHPDPIAVTLESGTGLESVYAMRMYLPLVDPSSLTLGRVEDDVLVGADGVRRRVRLASVLRRCVVTGAELDGAYLIIRFSPDPTVWPV